MKKSTAGRVFLFLFALPFASVALGFLFLSVIAGLYEWQQIKSWEPVQAQLLSAKLESYNKSTYQALATYQYRYQMVDYTSSRVAIFSGSDNIGDFHRTLGYELKYALDNQQPVTAWVNPDNPADAVLNGDMRWDLLGFKMIFVLVFGLIGGGLMVVAFKSSHGATDHPDGATKPWLTQKEWANRQIRCNGKSAVWFLWAFALFWNLISSPVLLDFTDEWNSGNKLILIAMLFPVAGMVLLALAFRYTLSWRRFGQLTLNLDPYPGSIGGQVGGHLEVPIAYQSQQRFPVTLQCLRRYTTGSGKNRQTHEKTLWSSSGVARSQASVTGGTLLGICFNVPPDLPPSEAPGNDYTCWRLTITADLPGIDLDRQFDLPVFATAQQTSAGLPLSTDHPQAIEEQEKQFERVANLEQIPGGVRMVFPMLHNWGNNLVGLLCGIFFGGAGLLMHFHGKAPGVIVWTFTAIGTLIAILSLRMLFTRLEVQLDHNGILSARYWLGIPLGRTRLERAQVRLLGLEKGSDLRSSQHHLPEYKIFAYPRKGKKMLVAMNLQGKENAQFALDGIAALTGYPVE